MREQGQKHVGGVIGRRMRAKDYCSQISRHVHKSMHAHTHTHLPSNSAGPTPTIIIDMGRDAACGVDGATIGTSEVGEEAANILSIRVLS